MFCRVVQAYTAITDTWDVIKSLGVNAGLASTYLITAVSHVISNLCSTVSRGLTSIVSEIWDWMKSKIPSVVSWVDHLRGVFPSKAPAIANATWYVN